MFNKRQISARLGWLFLASLYAWNASADSSQNCETATEGSAVPECYVEELKVFLEDWVHAWADGDIDTYLSLYVNEASPVPELTREDWEYQRRRHVTPDKGIELILELDSMGVGDRGHLDVIFLQRYESHDYADIVKKQLHLVQDRGRFRILKEVNVNEAVVLR